MSLDPATDTTWEWHRPHGSDVEYLIGQATAGHIVRTDPEEPPSRYAKAVLVAVPEMLALLREEPKIRCDHRDAQVCPDVASGFPPCWRHRLDALLHRLDIA